MPSFKTTAVICNKLGLHARAAARFVKLAGEFDANITVWRADDETNKVVGTSILGLMMLGAEPGTSLNLEAEGEEAEAAIRELSALITRKFDEN